MPCSRPGIAQAHTQAVEVPSLLWPESATGEWNVFLRTQKEVSIGTRRAQLPWWTVSSQPGTFQPEPSFDNTGCLGSGY